MSVTAGPLCIIATAAYGSDLAAPVQFLRNFRNVDVQGTYLGSGFLVAFNAWYYSWAPGIAQLELGNSMLRAAVRAAILPLLGALTLSHGVFNLLAGGVGPEFAILTAGLMASGLVGLCYLTPIAYAATRLSRRRITRKTFLYLGIFGVALALLGTLTHGTFGLTENLTAILVLETVLTAPIALARKLDNLTFPSIKIVIK